MHDINILGNILVKEGSFLCGWRSNRVITRITATAKRFSCNKATEEQIKAHHMIKLKRAETEGNTEDVEYYKSLITDLDALIGEEEQTPAPEDVLN